MAQLRRFDQAFRHRNLRILLICFAERRWAEAFLEETGAPYPLLMDPEMKSYSAYGLSRSVVRTCLSPATIWHYLKAILRGRSIHLKARGNPYQMGGDFLVARDGRLLLAHPSREPADRPSVREILEAMPKVQSPRSKVGEKETGGRRPGTGR